MESFFLLVKGWYRLINGVVDSNGFFVMMELCKYCNHADIRENGVGK